MIEFLIKKHKLDRRECWIIGDRWKDIVAGRRSHLNTIFIGDIYISPPEYEHIVPDYIRSNVLEACLLIEEIELYG